MTPEVKEFMESMRYVYSKRDGLFHLWKKNSDREIARATPEAAGRLYHQFRLRELRARCDELVAYLAVHGGAMPRLRALDIRNRIADLSNQIAQLEDKL